MYHFSCKNFAQTFNSKYDFQKISLSCLNDLSWLSVFQNGVVPEVISDLSSSPRALVGSKCKSLQKSWRILEEADICGRSILYPLLLSWQLVANSSIVKLVTTQTNPFSVNWEICSTVVKLFLVYLSSDNCFNFFKQLLFLSNFCRRLLLLEKTIGWAVFNISRCAVHQCCWGVLEYADIDELKGNVWPPPHAFPTPSLSPSDASRFVLELTANKDNRLLFVWE